MAPPARACGRDGRDARAASVARLHRRRRGSKVRDRYTEADDPKRLIELEQMLQRATEAHESGPRSRRRSTCMRGVIERRKDTEDAYRKLALVYWRQGRAGRRRRDAGARASQRRHAERGAHQAGAVPDGVGPGRAGHRAARGHGRARILTRSSPSATPTSARTRSKEAIATFERLLAIDPANALAYENIGAAHLHARNAAAAERGAAPRDRARSRRSPARTPRSASCWRRHGPPRRGDRGVEAGAVDRSGRTQRALQHHREPGRSRTPRRGAPVRRPVHRRGAAWHARGRRSHPAPAWRAERRREEARTAACAAAANAHRRAAPRRRWLAPALIAVAVLLAYSNALSGPFIFDDRGTIIDNHTIEDLWSRQVLVGAARNARGGPAGRQSLVRPQLRGRWTRRDRLSRRQHRDPSALRLVLFGIARRAQPSAERCRAGDRARSGRCIRSTPRR